MGVCDEGMSVYINVLLLSVHHSREWFWILGQSSPLSFCTTCMCLWLYSLTLLAEVLDGVKIYFDFMLADHLLYSQEKAQYKNVVEENRAPMSSGDHGSAENSHCLNSSAENSCTTNSDASSKMDVDQKPVAPLSSVLMPSSVYGVEHLLRLFVRMPLFLAQAQLPTSHVHTLHQYWKDLLGLVPTLRFLFIACSPLVSYPDPPPKRVEGESSTSSPLSSYYEQLGNKT